MLYTDKQKMIITEVMVIANYQKMISIKQMRSIIQIYANDSSDKFEEDFLVLQCLDILSQCKDIKLVVHEYLIHNCETLA
jgi:hypothetical protein